MTVVYTFAVIRLRSDVLYDVMLGPGAGLFAMPAPMQTALLVSILIAPVLMAWCIRLEQPLQKNERLRLNLLEN